MATFSALLFAATALAQGTKYGNNHVVTQFDSQIVEQKAFPAPNVTLYSPAFAPNASFAPGWTEGSEGATSQADLGMFSRFLAEDLANKVRCLPVKFRAEELGMGDIRQCRFSERRGQLLPLCSSCNLFEFDEQSACMDPSFCAWQ